MTPTGVGRFPTGFRRRLALIFVLVAGAAAGTLALGALAVVTQQRHANFRDRARADIAEEIARLERTGPASALVTRFERSEQPGGPDVLVIEGGAASTSIETLRPEDVPTELRTAAAAQTGEIVEGTAVIGGRSFLVLGEHLGQRDAEVYFFFPRSEVLRGLSELRSTLLLGWVTVVAAAAVVGTVVARRTLRPVREAADAARSVTEGLLDTRLAAEGSDEFAQWAVSFNEMVAALEDKIDALARARDRERRFNADVAHELRTPLGALVTAASLLEDHRGDLPEHLRRPTALVVGSTRRLHRLVDELLELHRLEAGQEAVDHEQVDLAQAVQATLAAHGWDESVRVDAVDRPVLLTDRRRIDRILANLVGNALTHGGPDVEVALRVDGDDAVVTVTDDGPGIAAEDQPHLFDRYYKVSHARTNPTRTAATGGSGLGLSIALEQARLLGGSLEVESAPGEGATFRLRLPLRDGDGTGDGTG